MRVSEMYHLGVTQASLDFVDVDVADDVPACIDPAAISIQTGEWAARCQELLQSFFGELLAAINHGDKARIAQLVLHLGEPNETHLGFSKGRSRGRGLGNGRRAQAVVDALAKSKAAKTGLLRDLEETALFVEGVGPDIISDITTAVIREPLIEYTQEMCKFYRIPMVDQWSGFMWNPAAKQWFDLPSVKLPRGESDKLLLVPKSIVRLSMITDTGKYYRGHLRPYMIDDFLDRHPTSHLIETLKNGRRKVRLGDFDDSVGTKKPDLVEHTNAFPTALDDYREDKTLEAFPPPDRATLERELGADPVDYQELLDAIRAIAPGTAGANSYHRAVADLLTALFDASLGNEQIEQPIHAGRKRIDIRYDNIAGTGFFRWLSLHHECSTIPVECKNYTADPKNPELDQLAGRFSPRRGRFGILVCRTIENKALFRQRCRDTADDDRGFIIALDDDDLEMLVNEAERVRDLDLDERSEYPLLRDLFDGLIS